MAAKKKNVKIKTGVKKLKNVGYMQKKLKQHMKRLKGK